MREGQTLDGFRLERRLGSGAMGTVWAASDPGGRPCALKTMHPHLAEDGELIRRFRREYEVGRAVKHPSVVGMLHYGQGPESPFIVMELAQGKNLKRLIDRGGPFFDGEVTMIGHQIASGLAALHAVGAIHRDLKSSNIVVARSLKATLIDFGIAKLYGGADLTPTNGFMGTAEYCAPEPNFGRKLTAASDMYSLGIVLYEALVGEVPFRSDRYTDTLQMQAQRPVPNVAQVRPMVEPRLAAIITAMLQKHPEARPTAAAAAKELADIAVGLGKTPRPTRSVPPTESMRPEPQGESHRRSFGEGSSRPTTDRSQARRTAIAAVVTSGVALAFVATAVAMAAAQ